MTLPAVQPVLQTARLILRPFRPEDAAAVRELAGERRVAEMTLSIPHPYPEGAAEAWIATHPARWQEGTDVVYAVVERETGTLVGAVGLAVRAEHRQGELGYWIGVPWWGRGYATEAAGALVRFGFNLLGLHRIMARHFARNPASGAVLRKIGMRPEGVQREHVLRAGRFEDVALYGMLAGELPAGGGGPA